MHHFNLKLDWSIIDLKLISRHFTGHRAIFCSICRSFSLSPNLCPQTAYQTSQRKFIQPNKPAPGTKNFSHPSSQVNLPNSSAVPLCICLNESVCPYLKCRFLHCCAVCSDRQPRAVFFLQVQPPSNPSKRWINTYLHPSTFKNFLMLYIFYPLSLLCKFPHIWSYPRILAGLSFNPSSLYVGKNLFDFKRTRSSRHSNPERIGQRVFDWSLQPFPIPYFLH